MPGRAGSEFTGKVSWKREGALREFYLVYTPATLLFFT